MSAFIAHQNMLNIVVQLITVQWHPAPYTPN